MFIYPVSYIGDYPSFSPNELFAQGEQGAWYDTSDSNTLFQERTGLSATTPAGVGDPVGTMLDKSGNGNHATAPSDAARPVLRQTAGGLYYLETDGVDDRLDADSLSGIQSGEDRPLGYAHAVKAVSDTGTNVFSFSNSTNSIALVEDYIPQQGDVWNPLQKRDDADNLKNSGVAANPNVVKVRLGSMSGTDLEWRNNGQVVDTLDRNVGVTTLDLFTIGGNRRSGSFGDVEEIELYGLIIIDRAFSEEEKESVEQYLANKSGVTL